MKFIINFLLGLIFGFGLILSNIFDPKTIILFFQWDTNQNSTILFTIFGIIMTSLIFSFIGFKVNIKSKNVFLKNQDSNLQRSQIFGAVLFGAGWGLSGLCVSTATINLAFNEWQNLLFFVFMVLGFYGPSFFKKITL